MAKALGTTIQNISARVTRFLNKVEKHDDELNFSNNHLKLIKIEGSRQAVQFYSFSIFTYLAHRINTKEALLMVNYIQEAYNDKSNKDN
jgi:hypothetical protein